MNKLRKWMIAALLAIALSPLASYGQEVFVDARPAMPRYERAVAPSPRHVWIDEDWELRGGHYVFVGGHWVVPPHRGMVWAPGHWMRRPRGWFWVRGHWR